MILYFRDNLKEIIIYLYIKKTLIWNDENLEHYIHIDLNRVKISHNHNQLLF